MNLLKMFKRWNSKRKFKKLHEREKHLMIMLGIDPENLIKRGHL